MLTKRSITLKQRKMARIFITGSSDGLGSLTAKKLIQRGHQVVLHARNAKRADDANAACPGAEACLIADLTSTEETQKLAKEVNKLGPFDAVIHNAGLYRGVSGLKGKEGLPALFAVNTLAPYILTCLVRPPPKHLVFVSSGLHSGGDPSLRDLRNCGYGDSKLHNILLAFAFARKWEGKVASNAMDPGWVPTKMGGASAMDDIDAAVDTYVMLAEGSGAAEGMTSKYWYQGRTRSCKAAASDVKVQDKLLRELETISGVKVPDDAASML